MGRYIDKHYIFNRNALKLLLRKIDFSAEQLSFIGNKLKVRRLLLFLTFCLCLRSFAQSAQQVPDLKHATSLYDSKQYPEAIKELESIAIGIPRNSAAFRSAALMIGQSYFMMAQAPKAIPWLEQGGSSNEVNYMLGYAYFLAQQPDASEAAFARLFQVRPDSAAGHLITGQMLLKKEYEKEAAAEIQKALSLNPSIPEAHFILGEIAIYAGRAEEGIAEMSKELEINPNYSMAWYRLGDAYTRLEKWDEAIPNLQRAIWLNQNFSGPYVLLGKSYLKTKDLSNAEGMLRHALSLDPRNYSGTYLLAQTLSAEGKRDESHQVLERLKTLNEER
jgi:tetratricopeptide (TPR) repeat protein